MRLSTLANRKAVQLYVVLMIGFFCYLHFRYVRRSSAVAVEVSSSYSRFGYEDLVKHQHQHQQQQYTGGEGPAHGRFILGLNYWEQLTMATGNLLSLVCLGEQWNATTVQPFTFNSRLYGLQNFKPDDNLKQNKSAHALDLIYDMDSFSQLLLSYGLPRLAPFQTFLQQAPREVTVVHYISAKETHELAIMKGGTKTRLEQGFRQDPVVDCREHLPSFRSMIEGALNRELSDSHRPLTSVTSQDQELFHVGRYWCVNMTHFSTPQKSALKMGLAGGEEATIVILNWRGVGKSQVVRNSAKGLHSNNRVAMVDACQHHLGVQWRGMIGYSPVVLKTAKLFAASLGITSTDQYAAVHIRSEKLGLREKRIHGVTLQCFKELMRQVDAFSEKHPSFKVVFITDYGPYSSDTCRKCKGAKEVYKYLLKRNIKTTYFEPAQFNVTHDSGFAAAVESQFIASASALFLCGGGGYQMQMATRFLHGNELRTTQTATRNSNSNSREIFRVCSEDSDVSKLLKSAN